MVGDNEPLETSCKVLRIHVGRVFEVGKGVFVGIVGIDSRVNVKKGLGY
jgi:hypothetical protein